MLNPVKIEDFGGLDLRSDPEQSACVDCLNVQLEKGYVRTREGFTHKLTGAQTADILRIGNHSRDTETHGVLFVNEDADMVYSAYGAGSKTTMTGSINGQQHGFVTFGGSAGLRTYYGGGNATTEFSRIDSTPSLTATITNPGATDTSGGGTVELAILPTDNRLAWCFRDRVWFSDAGVPETFGANNYIDLDPNDGERIVAAVTWRDLLFVFKQTKFFVFYGTSTDSTGEPVFNYRRVDGMGIPFNAFGAACESPEAVFFVGSDGIYSTTGAPPVCISRDLDPVWGRSPMPAAYQGGRVQSGDEDHGSVAWSQGRLYVTLATGGTDDPNAMFVYVPGLGWAYWNVAAHYLLDRRGNPGLAVALNNGSFQIGEFTSLTQTTDAGTAIVSRYRSGFTDFGTPVEKVIRETELTGIGTPSFAWSRDFGSLDTASTVTLGTSPATARGRHRTAKRGSTFSWQASATSGAWRLNRVVPMLRESRGPGEKTT